MRWGIPVLSTSQSSISSVVDHFLCCFTDTVTEKFRMVQEKKKSSKTYWKAFIFYSLPPPYLSCGTANQYSCFLSLCAYCCIDALACETNVFLMGFPTLRHRNLWDRCRLFSFVREEPISKEKVSYPQCTKELNKIISPFCI